MKQHLYFAYGMNTNVNGMAQRCPAAVSHGHAILLNHVLTKWQLNWKDQLAQFYGNWLHEGQIMDPVMRDIEAFLENAQENVTGTVFVQLHPYRFTVIGIESAFDLMSSKFGKYGESIVTGKQIGRAHV